MVPRFLIDTDTASDDAVALVMALRHPGIRVEAITVVAGNVPLEQAVQNALYTVDLCGASVPVYAGLAAPLQRPLFTAEDVHGRDGMGDIGLPLKGRQPTPGDGVQALIDTVRRSPGEVTLVTLGPLTNVAAALLRAPDIAAMIPRCVMMGGTGQGYGNVTPVAEFNFYVDPEAADIVFTSGMPLTMVGWDISRLYATFDAAQAAEIRALDTPLARFCMDIQVTVDHFAQTNTALAGFDLPDPITMAVALDPAVATDVRRLHVAIETHSSLCRGQTVVDHLGMTGQLPNTDVVLAADRERFVALLRGAVAP